MIKLSPNYKLLESHTAEVSKTVKIQIARVIKDKGIVIGGNLISLSPRLRLLFRYLNNYNLIDLFIRKEPTELNDVIDFITNHWIELTKEDENDYKIIYNIFVNHAYKKLDKDNFIRNIGLDSCPYCNRNYIYCVSRKRKVKPEIDHFYPKSTYPLLAVSFFNLIPSCQSCNGFYGKSKSNPYLIGLISPYVINNDDFVFTYKINNISIINPLNGKSSIDVLFKNKIQVNSDLFNLEDLYSLHNDHVLELILKRKVKYSKKYRDYLNSYNGLRFSKKEIDRMILGNYSEEKDIHKRPLAKLYQDIGKELGLI